MCQEKKPYQKPTLTTVILIPEENVLAICEQGTATGEYNPPVPCYGIIGSCQDET
jgi:hypothetical protein